MTGLDVRDGLAGKGLDTQGKAAGFELRTQAQEEAIGLHFAQNWSQDYKGACTEFNEDNTKKCKMMG